MTTQTMRLRWCDDQNQLMLAGVERAEQEKQRADATGARAQRLAEQLRALGVEVEDDG